MARVCVTALAAMMVIGSATAAVAGDAEDCSNHKALLKTDPARTVSACRRVAEQGVALGQSNRGVMYYTCEGVPQDFKEAVNWFRRAAAQGDAHAQSNLGLAYANGWGVSQDYKEAVKWYRKAAAQGSAAAQFNLGNMYDRGQGVPQDYVQAHVWFDLAAAGYPPGPDRNDAVKHRDLVTSKMTPVQLEEAQRLAREKKPKPETQ
jgi:uncharacterized protein